VPSRSSRKYGRLVQVELDALPPDVLRGLCQDAVDRFWNTYRFRLLSSASAAERERLQVVSA
jgi:hypothetical protein